jgi:hypothetical protein
MKVTRYFVIALATLALAATAEARPRPQGFGGKRFEANKQFGLGLELGAPFGVTGKYFYSEDKAFDFGVGDIYNYYDYRGLYIYGDHLWHPAVLASADAFELPFYIGVGGSFFHWDDLRGPVDRHGDALVFRVPVGIAFDFNNVPLDVFVQLVPSLPLFFNTPDGYDRTLFFFIDGSVGIRYWFQ